MKINRYECDNCGMPITNGREYKVTLKFPIPKDIAVPDRWDRKQRKSKSVDLCYTCFKNSLAKLFGKEKEEVK